MLKIINLAKILLNCSIMTEARSRLLKFENHLTKEAELFGGEFEIPSIAESLKNVMLMRL